MTDFFIRLEGEPKPQARPRTFFNKRINKVTTWSPKDGQEPYLLQMIKHMPAEKIGGPLKVEFFFYLSRPKGHFTKAGKRSSQWIRYPTKKPDYDNLVKGVQDGLVQYIIVDDSLIVESHIHKCYADNCSPGTEIHITKLDQ